MLWIRFRLDPELFPGFGIICFGSGSRQKGKKKKQKNNKILHLFRFHCTDNTGTVECSIKVIPVADFLNSYFGFSFTFSEMFKIIPARTLNSYKVGAGSRINNSGFTTLQLTNHLYNTFFYLLSCKKTLHHPSPKRPYCGCILTSPGAGEGGGVAGLPVGEGGEVADALAPLDRPVPDLQITTVLLSTNHDKTCISNLQYIDNDFLDDIF